MGARLNDVSQNSRTINDSIRSTILFWCFSGSEKNVPGILGPFLSLLTVYDKVQVSSIRVLIEPDLPPCHLPPPQSAPKGHLYCEFT